MNQLVRNLYNEAGNELRNLIKFKELHSRLASLVKEKQLHVSNTIEEGCKKIIARDILYS